jgi:hypothetical protein
LSTEARKLVKGSDTLIVVIKTWRELAEHHTEKTSRQANAILNSQIIRSQKPFCLMNAWHEFITCKYILNLLHF